MSIRALDVMEGLVDFMGGLPGRRMVLLASPGFLVRTLESQQQELIDHALRANVVVNALDSKGLYADDFHLELQLRGPNAAEMLRGLMSLSAKQNETSKDIMAILTRSTGGLFFEDINDLTFGLRELGMIPEVSYQLAFSPEEAPNGKFHALKVRLKSRNNYLIQARPGHFAATQMRQGASAQERRLDHEVMTSEVVKELAAAISSEPAKTDAGGPALEVVLNVHARKFHFIEKDGVHTQSLIFIATLFDDSGNFVTGTELNVRFALQEPTFTRLTETGLEMSVTLEAPPGTYRLRGVAQDGIDGKVPASTLPVQIR